MTAKCRSGVAALAAGALLASLGGAPSFAQLSSPGDAAPPEVTACFDAVPGDDPAAILALCQSALAVAPTDEVRGEVNAWIALAASAAGDHQTAIAAGDRAAALYPLAETFNVAAQVRVGAGRYDDALALTESALRRFPADPALRRTRLITFAALGRRGEVVADLEDLHRETPDDILLAVTLIGALNDVDETRRRDQILDRAIARNPEAPELRIARAVMWMPTRPGDALKDLDAAIAHGPTGEAYALRAFARFATGDLDGCRDDLGAVTDPAGVGDIALVYASFAAEGVEDLDRALAFAERLVDSAGPQDLPTSLARRGQVLLKQGERDLAKADFERAALLDPEEANAWGGLGELALASDPAQAAVFYRRAHAIDPDDTTFEVGLADALFWISDYQGAVAIYSSLVKRYPDDAGIHASLAATLFRLERFEEAERPSARAVALAPGNPEYRLIRGEALYLLGEADGALEQMDRLAAAGADTAYSRYIAAVIRRNKGDYEAALRETDAGLALAPDDADLMEERGGVYYMLDDPLSAREWLDKALAINPDLAGALLVRGLVRAELGDAEGAAADKAAAIALDPSLAEEP